MRVPISALPDVAEHSQLLRRRLGVVVLAEKPETARAIVVDKRVEGLVKGSQGRGVWCG